MDRLANKIASHERKLQALELRKAGASYAAIAEQLGYRSGSGAHAAVKAALRDTLREPADEVRKLELERLDAALLAIWRRVQAGDYAAIDRLIAIVNSRAKLTGTFAPKKLEYTGPTMTPEGAIVISPEDQQALVTKVEAKIAEMKERLAAGPPVEDLSGCSPIEQMLLSEIREERLQGER
jgi:hypothetical protein